MKKRALSMLLAVLMVFMLLPAAALAAEPENPAPVADADDALHMTKNLVENEDGSYKVVIEAWSTGQVSTETVTEVVPTDFVLVVDQSGSMSESIPVAPTESDKVSSVTVSQIQRDPYFVKLDGVYYRLYVNETWHLFSSNEYRVYYNKDGSTVTLMNTTNTNAQVTGYDLYKTSTTTRIQALKSAANKFLDLVKEKADAAGDQGDHRVAIVGFSSSRYDTHKQILSELQSVRTESGMTVLQTAVGNIRANGGTEPVGGLDAAQDILENHRTAAEKVYTKSNGETAYRNTVVVFFTDGHPGNNDEADMIAEANKAVTSAYTLKHNEYATKIFSIGVFADGDDEPLTFYADVNGSSRDNCISSSGNWLIGYSSYFRGNKIDGPQAYNDTIADYMRCVSSEYPDARNFLNHRGTSDSGTYSNDRGAKDNNQYYTIAGDSSALEKAFEMVASSSITPSTQTELNADAVLKDTIYTRDFDTSNATVSAETRTIQWDAENEAVKEVAGSTSNLPDGSITETVRTDGKVAVTNFNYSELYCTDGHDGKKLVITIDGLQPKVAGNLFSNSGNAAIYPDDTSLTPALDIVSPRVRIDDKASYIIDFNAKMTLRSGVSKLFPTAENNGTFFLSNDSLSYQYKPQQMDSSSANLVMQGVDTAMAFGTNSATSKDVWTQISAIPANNIYFDDALLNHDALTYEGGEGRNSGVETAISSGATETTPDTYYITFQGTGIDVYCTTDTETGYVQSAIVTDKSDLKNTLVYQKDANGSFVKNDEGKYIKADDNTPADAERYASTLKAVMSYSKDATRYNVPTVFYDNLDPNQTYTLYLKVMEGSHFKLDGVRVYNAMGKDESVYDDTIEQNAKFFNLREYLLNDGTGVTFADPTKESLEAADKTTLREGILFIDDANSVSFKKTIKGDNGQPELDANGEEIKVDAYANAYDAYVANGPKNEIYLAANQSIVFTIDQLPANGNYWLGLSAPDQGKDSGEVTVVTLVDGEEAAQKITLDSAVDMYYKLDNVNSGEITVTNTSDNMIAITNLKVTGEATKMVTFGKLNTRLLSMASYSVNAPAVVEPTPDTISGIRDLVKQLFSNFVTALFQNISRMFGK